MRPHNVRLEATITCDCRHEFTHKVRIPLKRRHSPEPCGSHRVGGDSASAMAARCDPPIINPSHILWGTQSHVMRSPTANLELLGPPTNTRLCSRSSRSGSMSRSES